MPATPIFGGPGSLDGSFEGMLDANCNGQDGATSYWPDNPQDCDHFVSDAPDGQQVFRDGAGGSGEAYSWASAFSHPSSDLWTDIHYKLENDVRSFNNSFCLLDERDENTFHCLNLHSDGRDPVRVVAGSVTCKFENARAVGSWCEYLYHANTQTGRAELWCDCGGRASACGDDLNAPQPDLVCNGTPQSQARFDGFVLYGSSAGSAWQIDDIAIYDARPASVPEPAFIPALACALMLLAVLRRFSRRRRLRA